MRQWVCAPAPNENGHTKRIKLQNAARSTVRNASLSHLLSEFCSGNITRIQHSCHCHCQHRSKAKKRRLSAFFGGTFYLRLSFGVFAAAPAVLDLLCGVFENFRLRTSVEGSFPPLRRHNHFSGSIHHATRSVVCAPAVSAAQQLSLAAGTLLTAHAHVAAGQGKRKMVSYRASGPVSKTRSPPISFSPLSISQVQTFVRLSTERVILFRKLFPFGVRR